MLITVKFYDKNGAEHDAVMGLNAENTKAAWFYDAAERLRYLKVQHPHLTGFSVFKDGKRVGNYEEL